MQRFIRAGRAYVCGCLLSIGLVRRIAHLRPPATSPFRKRKRGRSMSSVPTQPISVPRTPCGYADSRASISVGIAVRCCEKAQVSARFRAADTPSTGQCQQSVKTQCMPKTHSHALARAQHVYAYLAVIVGLVLLATPAAAHDYWIERSDDGYTLFQGHVYASHKGEERVPYDPAIVERIACVRADGDVTTLEPVRAYPVRVSARCSAVLIEVSSGYWTQTLTETIQKPKSAVLGALRGWRSEEAVKRIDLWTTRVALPLSDGFEMVPLEDPFRLKPGDKLRLLVTWRGQPKRGVAVAYDGNARGVTGADGQANIRIRHGGVQTLSASFEEAVQDPQAEKVVHGTILQLELPK